mgnify:CR=1 FL=1
MSFNLLKSSSFPRRTAIIFKLILCSSLIEIDEPIEIWRKRENISFVQISSNLKNSIFSGNSNCIESIVLSEWYIFDAIGEMNSAIILSILTWHLPNWNTKVYSPVIIFFIPSDESEIDLEFI